MASIFPSRIVSNNLKRGITVNKTSNTPLPVFSTYPNEEKQFSPQKIHISENKQKKVFIPNSYARLYLARTAHLERCKNLLEMSKNHFHNFLKA